MKTPNFGDIIVNHWQSDDNPFQRSRFVRIVTHLRQKCWQVIHHDGSIGDLICSDKLEVIPQSDENARLRNALEDIEKWSACRCEPCWTDRGKHAPECKIEIYEEATQALKGDSKK